MITISHTHAEGTVATGTSKGDGAGDILKGNGFGFRYGAWRIRGSRDRMASWRIDAAAKALRDAGFEVAVEVDNTPRPTAEVEAERTERAGARADRFAGYSENAATRSDAASERARQIQEHIPLGQPVLVGHHSQARHERDIERIEKGWAVAAQEESKAGYWAGRAESAENSQRYREGIGTTLRRIDRLEADLWAAQRRVANRRVQPIEPTALDHEIAQLEDQIAHWKARIAEAEAAGVKIWRQEDFTRGDLIQCGGSRWHRVVRANKRTLSLQNPSSPNLKPVTVPYDAVTGHRPVDAAELRDAR